MPLDKQLANQCQDPSSKSRSELEQFHSILPYLDSYRLLDSDLRNGKENIGEFTMPLVK